MKRHQGWQRNWIWLRTLLIVAGVILAGCQLMQTKGIPATDAGVPTATAYNYKIGPGDKLNIFVWRNPDVSVNGIAVRPDGKISSPLVTDMQAAGKTPAELAKDIEKVLAAYIKEPFVTISVVDFVGSASQQVRVVGEATTPKVLPYREDMTLLDVMIAVGGLTEFADGNKASIVRTVNGKQEKLNVRLEDLVKDGDISANVKIAPGDIIIIPESLF